MFYQKVLALLVGGILAAENVMAQGRVIREDATSQVNSTLNNSFGETYGEKIIRQTQEENQKAEKKEESDIFLTSSSQATEIDYGGIADVMFAKQKEAEQRQDLQEEQENQDKIIELKDKTSHISLKNGRVLEIKLALQNNIKWNFDKNYKALEYISDREEVGFLKIVFKGKDKGNETLYFDSLDMSNPLNVKVVETRLLLVKVE